MKEGKSYIKDTADFLDKLKDLGEIPEGAILVTADVVGLYPSIPHTEGLEVLRKQYDKFLHKKVPTEDIVKMADFVLKNDFFEFNFKFFQQISGTAIGTKFAPPPPSAHMFVLLWTTLKQNFSRHNLYNRGCGNDSLTMYFLFGRTVRKT